jgi:hypothetical protein
MIIMDLILIILGEIMKMGYTFACFMRKKTVFSQVLQLPAYKSIFFVFRISLFSKNKTCEELC